MAIRPIVGTPLASCCTILSILGVVILVVLGLAFDADVSNSSLLHPTYKKKKNTS